MVLPQRKHIHNRRRRSGLLSCSSCERGHYHSTTWVREQAAFFLLVTTIVAIMSSSFPSSLFTFASASPLACAEQSSEPVHLEGYGQFTYDTLAHIEQLEYSFTPQDMLLNGGYAKMTLNLCALDACPCANCTGMPVTDAFLYLCQPDPSADNAAYPMSNPAAVGTYTAADGETTLPMVTYTFEKDVAPHKKFTVLVKCDPASASRNPSNATLIPSSTGTSATVFTGSICPHTRSASTSPSDDATRSATKSDVATRSHTDTNAPSRSRTNSDIKSRSHTNTDAPSRTLTRSDVPSHSNTESDAKTRSRTDSNVPTRSNTRSDAPSRSRTDSDVPSKSTTESDVPTRSHTHSDVPTRSRTESDVPTNTVTHAPTRSQTDSDIPTRSHTASHLPTRSQTESDVPTRSPTASDQPTRSRTESHVPTATHTSSKSDEPTRSRTFSAAPTRSTTFSPSDTFSPSESASPSDSEVPSRSLTESDIPTETPTGSHSASHTFTVSPSPSASSTRSGGSLSGSTSVSLSPTDSKTVSGGTQSGSKTASVSPTVSPAPTESPSASLPPTGSATFSSTKSTTKSTTRSDSVSITRSPSVSGATPSLSISKTISHSPSMSATPSHPITASRTWTPPPTRTASFSLSPTLSVAPTRSATFSASPSFTPTSTHPPTGTKTFSHTVSSSVSSSMSFSDSVSVSPTITPPPTPTESLSVSVSISSTITPPPTPTRSVSVSISDTISASETLIATETHNITATESLELTNSSSTTVSASITTTETASFGTVSTSMSVEPATILNVSDLIANHSTGVLATAMPLPSTWELQLFDDKDSGELVVTTLLPAAGGVAPQSTDSRPIVAAMTTMDITDNDKVLVSAVYMPSSKTSRLLVVPLGGLFAPVNAYRSILLETNLVEFFGDYRVFQHTSEQLVVVGPSKIFLVKVNVTDSDGLHAEVVGSLDFNQTLSIGSNGTHVYAPTTSKFMLFPNANLLLISSRGERMCYVTIPINEEGAAAVFNTSDAVASPIACLKPVTTDPINNPIVLCRMNNHTHVDENPFDNRFVVPPRTLFAGAVQTRRGYVDWILIVDAYTVMEAEHIEYFAWPLTRDVLVIDTNPPGVLNDLNMRLVGVSGHLMRMPNPFQDYHRKNVPMQDLKQAGGVPVTVGPTLARAPNSSILVATGTVFYQLDPDLQIVDVVDIGLEITAIIVAERYPADRQQYPDVALVGLAPNLLLTAFFAPAPDMHAARKMMFGNVIRLPATNDTITGAVSVPSQSCSVSMSKGKVVSGWVLIITTTSSTLHCCYNANQLVVDVKTIAATASNDEPPVVDNFSSLVDVKKSGHSAHATPSALFVPVRVSGNVMVSSTAHTLRMSTLGSYLQTALNDQSDSLFTTTQRRIPALTLSDAMLHTSSLGPAFASLLNVEGNDVVNGGASSAHPTQASSISNETMVTINQPNFWSVRNDDTNGWKVPLGQDCLASTKLGLLPDSDILHFFCIAEQKEEGEERSDLSSSNNNETNSTTSSSFILTHHLVDISSGPNSYENISWILDSSSIDARNNSVAATPTIVGVATQRLKQQNDTMFRSVVAIGRDLIIFDTVYTTADRVGSDVDVFELYVHQVARSSSAPEYTGSATDVEIAEDGDHFFILTTTHVHAFNMFPDVTPIWTSAKAPPSRDDHSVGDERHNTSVNSTICNTSLPFGRCGLQVQEELCPYGGPCNVLALDNVRGQLVGFHSSPTTAATTPSGSNPSTLAATRTPLWVMEDPFFASVAAPLITWRSRVFVFSAANWSVSCYHQIETKSKPVFQWSLAIFDATSNPNIKNDSDDDGRRPVRSVAPFGKNASAVSAHLGVTDLGMLYAIVTTTSDTTPVVYSYSVAMGIDVITGAERWRVVPSATVVRNVQDASNSAIVYDQLFVQSESFVSDPARASAIWNENVLLTQIADEQLSTSSRLAANSTAEESDDALMDAGSLLERRTILGINVLNGSILFEVPLYTRRNFLFNRVEPLLLHIVNPHPWGVPGQRSVRPRSGSTKDPTLQLLVTGGMCYDIEQGINDPHHGSRIVDSYFAAQGPVATCLWSFNLQVFPTGPTQIVPTAMSWMKGAGVSMQMFSFVGNLLALPETWRPDVAYWMWDGLTIRSSGRLPVDGGSGIDEVLLDAENLNLTGIVNWTALPSAKPSFAFAARAFYANSAVDQFEENITTPSFDASSASHKQLTTIHLNLAGNYLTGRWANHFVTSATQLQHLDLSNNWYDDTMTTFAGLPMSVLNFSIAGNPLLRGAPSLFQHDSLIHLSGFFRLQRLELGDTMLGVSGIHDKFLQYMPSSITHIDLHSAEFNGVPLFQLLKNDTVTKDQFLPNLRHLDISYNNFSDATELTSLWCESLPISLSHFDFSGSGYQMTVPTVFRRNDTLVELVAMAEAGRGPESILAAELLREDLVAAGLDAKPNGQQIFTHCSLNTMNASNNRFYGRVDLNNTVLSMTWVDLRNNLLTGDVSLLWLQQHSSSAVRIHQELARLRRAGIATELTPHVRNNNGEYEFDDAENPTPSPLSPWDNTPSSLTSMHLTILLNGNEFLQMFISDHCPVRFSEVLNVTMDPVRASMGGSDGPVRKGDDVPPPCTDAHATDNTGLFLFDDSHPMCTPNSTSIWYPVGDGTMNVMNPERGVDYMNCTIEMSKIVRNSQTGGVAYLNEIVEDIGACLPVGILIRSAFIGTDRLGLANVISIFYYHNEENLQAPAAMATVEQGHLYSSSMEFKNCSLLSNEFTSVCSVFSRGFYNLSVTPTSALLTFQDDTGRVYDCPYDGTLLLLSTTLEFGNIYPAMNLLGNGNPMLPGSKKNIKGCLPIGNPYTGFEQAIYRSNALTLQDAQRNGLPFYTELCENRPQLPQCKLLPQVPYKNDDGVRRGETEEDVCVYGVCAESRTFLWEPCQSSVWDFEGFADLNKCMPLSSIIRLLPDPNVQFSTSACTIDVGNSKQATCAQESGRYTTDALETIFSSNGRPDVDPVRYDNYCRHKDNVPCTNADSLLVENATTREVFCDLMEFFNLSRKEAMVKATCMDHGSKVLISACTSGTDIPLVIYNRQECAGGLNIKCSSCLPYIEPSATALPYAFLIISSTKDIIFILLGAYFLSKPWFRRPITGFLAKMAATLTPYNPREKDRFKYELFKILNPREIKIHQMVRVSEEILGYASYEGENDDEDYDADETSGWEIITSKVSGLGKKDKDGKGDGEGGTKKGTNQPKSLRAARRNRRGGNTANVFGGNTLTNLGAVGVGSDSLGSQQSVSGRQILEGSTNTPTHATAFDTNTPTHAAAVANSNNSFLGAAGSSQTSFTPHHTPLVHGTASHFEEQEEFPDGHQPIGPTRDRSNSGFDDCAAIRDAPQQLQEDFTQLYYPTRICERQQRLIANPKDPEVRKRFRRVFEIYAIIWKAEQENNTGFLTSEEFLGTKVENIKGDGTDDDEEELSRSAESTGGTMFTNIFGGGAAATKEPSASDKAAAYYAQPSLEDDEETDKTKKKGARRRALPSAPPPSQSVFSLPPAACDYGPEGPIHNGSFTGEEMQPISNDSTTAPFFDRSASQPPMQSDDANDNDAPPLPRQDNSVTKKDANDTDDTSAADCNMSTKKFAGRARSATMILKELNAVENEADGAAATQIQSRPPSRTPPPAAEGEDDAKHHASRPPHRRRHRSRSLMSTVATGLENFKQSVLEVTPAIITETFQHPDETEEKPKNRRRAYSSNIGKRTPPGEKPKEARPDKIDSKLDAPLLVTASTPTVPKPGSEEMQMMHQDPDTTARAADDVSNDARSSSGASERRGSKVRFAPEDDDEGAGDPKKPAGEDDDDEWVALGEDDFTTKDPKQRLEEHKALLAYALRELHDVAIMEPVILREEILDSRFTPQPWMLIFEFLYATVYFLVCIIQTTRVPGYTAWQLYQCVFFRYINSAVSIGLVVNSVLRRVYLDEKFTVDFYLFSSGILVLPVFFTHMIPGLLLYCWIPILILALWIPLCFVMRAFEKEYFYTLSPVSILFRVVFRLGMTAVVTLLLQSSFNWALLFYNRDPLNLDYLGVLTYEYESRLWGCFIESRLSSIANTIQFVSAFA